MHIRGTLVCSYRDVSENSRCMYYLKVHYLFALRESSVYYHIFKGTFMYIGRERERRQDPSFVIFRVSRLGEIYTSTWRLTGIYFIVGRGRVFGVVVVGFGFLRARCSEGGVEAFS